MHEGRQRHSTLLEHCSFEGFAVSTASKVEDRLFEDEEHPTIYHVSNTKTIFAVSLRGTKYQEPNRSLNKLHPLATAKFKNFKS